MVFVRRPHFQHTGIPMGGDASRDIALGSALNFLDLTIKIKGGFLSRKIYNKSDSFDFHPIGSVCKYSNMQDCVNVSGLFAQAFRFINICSYLLDFVALKRKLVAVFPSEGF